MQVLERARGVSATGRRLAQSLAQDVRQLDRFAVLHRINEDAPARTFRHDIDPIEPTFGIGPGCLAVTDHQKLIDPRQRDELGGKVIGLRRGGSKRLHHFGHFLRQLLGACHLRLIDLHPRAGKNLYIDKIDNFDKPLDVRRQIHDNEEIAARVIDDLAAGLQKRGKHPLHFRHGKKPHRDHLQGETVLLALARGPR